MEGDPSKGASTSVVQDEKNRLSPVFWAGLAGTVVFGGASGAMWGMAASKKSEEESVSETIDSKIDAWDTSNPDDELEEIKLRKDLDDLGNEMERYNRVAIVMTALTGAFAIMTVVGALVKKNKKERPSTTKVSAVPDGLKVSF